MLKIKHSKTTKSTGPTGKRKRTVEILSIDDMGQISFDNKNKEALISKLMSSGKGKNNEGKDDLIQKINNAKFKIHDNKLHVVVEQNTEEDLESMIDYTDRMEKMTEYSSETRSSNSLGINAKEFLLHALTSS